MHDPFTLLDGPDTPIPNPWESLATQARWLADLADQLAARDPADLAPDDDCDPLTELDERAAALRTISGACRRATWQALADDGLSNADIGRMWDKSRQHVGQVLLGKKRPR